MTPGRTVISAPLAGRSPYGASVKVTGNPVALGSTRYIHRRCGKCTCRYPTPEPRNRQLELAETNPLVSTHGGYYELGEKIGIPMVSREKK